MSSCSLIVRPPPNKPYIDGYPGLSNGKACLTGTIQVCPRGGSIKASWVAIRLEKLETVASNQRFKEVISMHTVWTAKYGSNRGHDAEPVAILSHKEFTFSLAIPESVPPSLSIGRGPASITYELVATCKYITKGGCFSTTKVHEAVATETIWVDKYEHLPPWPIFPHRAQSEDRSDEKYNVTMRAKRETISHGPGDSIAVGVVLRSMRVDPIRVTRIEMIVREVLTVRGGADGRASSQTISSLLEIRSNTGVLLFAPDEHFFQISATLPLSVKPTCATAKHISCIHHIKLVASLQKVNLSAPELVEDLCIDNLPLLISAFPDESSRLIVDQIVLFNDGQVPTELAAPPPAASTTAQPSIQSQSQSQSADSRPASVLATGQTSSQGSISSEVEPVSSDMAIQRRTVSSSSHRVSESQRRLNVAKRRLSERRQSAYVINPDPMERSSSQPAISQSVTLSTAEEEKVRLYNAAYAQVLDSAQIPSGPLPASYDAIADEKEEQIRRAYNADPAARAVSAYDMAVAERQKQAEALEAQYKAKLSVSAMNNVQPTSIPVLTAEQEKARLARSFGLPPLPNAANLSRSTSTSSSLVEEQTRYQAAVAARNTFYQIDEEASPVESNSTQWAPLDETASLSSGYTTFNRDPQIALGKQRMIDYSRRPSSNAFSLASPLP